MVVLKIEKEVIELTQTVGVRQGDNMAPVLFLFLMLAFAELLEAEWKREQIGVCTVRSYVGSYLTSGKGKLRGHLPKNIYHGISQQLKSSNAFMWMMVHLYSIHVLT